MNSQENQSISLSEQAIFKKFNFRFYERNSVISNEIIFKQNLKDSAFRLLCALEALPESWVIYQTKLSEMLGWGREKMQTAIKILIDEGYVRRTQKKREDGKFGISLFEFNMKPIFKNNPLIEEDNNNFNNLETNEELAGGGKAVTGEIGTGKSSTTSNIDRQVILLEENNHILRTTTTIKEKEETGGGGHKKIDVSEISYVTARGERKIVSETEIYSHFLKSGVPPDVLNRAIQELRQEKSPINNVMSFLEAVCKRLYSKKLSNFNIEVKKDTRPQPREMSKEEIKKYEEEKKINQEKQKEKMKQMGMLK